MARTHEARLRPRLILLDALGGVAGAVSAYLVFLLSSSVF